MADEIGGEDLLSDLIYLCKNEGASATRLAKVGFVNRALGGDDEDADVKIERLTSAVNSLPEDQPAVLLAAFGLSPETSGVANLKTRREIYGAAIGRGIDTVAAREKKALQQLRMHLLAGWYPASPIPQAVPEFHNGVINELTSVTTVVSDGRWMESRHHYRMLALFDEADYFALTTSYPMTITTYGGWTSGGEKANNGYEVRFYPPEPMRRGEVYNLEFSFSPPPGDPDGLNEPGAITEESLALHERTLEARFEVVFIGKKPDLIYKYSGLTSMQRPGKPKVEHILKYRESSLVGAYFADLYGGHYSGIAWIWKQA